MLRMARMARGAGAQHVLIITPPPVDEAGRPAGWHGARR